MAVAAPLYPHEEVRAGEARIVLNDVPWSTYLVLRDSVRDAHTRMTYLRGRLEIMSPSREHETDKKLIARLLELFCLERDIPLFGYGSTTFRREDKERGLEPDECYCRGEDRDMPDVALEVIASSGILDKLEVYAGLGVREVWLYEAGAFRVLALRGGRYEVVSRSEVFPELDFGRLAHHASQRDQHAALRAYRDELRTVK